MKNREVEIIPDTAMAEQWIDPDTFKFEGKLYRVMPTGKVVELRE